MLNFPPSVKIYLAAEPTDMRKGPESLSALVRRKNLDPFSGHLFTFVSKGRNRIKILTWSTGGYIVLYKGIEQGKSMDEPG